MFLLSVITLMNAYEAYMITMMVCGAASVRSLYGANVPPPAELLVDIEYYEGAPGTCLFSLDFHLEVPEGVELEAEIDEFIVVMDDEVSINTLPAPQATCTMQTNLLTPDGDAIIPQAFGIRNFNPAAFHLELAKYVTLH